LIRWALPRTSMRSDSGGTLRWTGSPSIGSVAAPRAPGHRTEDVSRRTVRHNADGELDVCARTRRQTRRACGSQDRTPRRSRTDTGYRAHSRNRQERSVSHAPRAHAGSDCRQIGNTRRA
jgi:hypothetical protein